MGEENLTPHWIVTLKREGEKNLHALSEDVVSKQRDRQVFESDTARIEHTPPHSYSSKKN